MSIVTQCAAAIAQVGSWMKVKKKEQTLSFIGSLQPKVLASKELSGPNGYGVERTYYLYVPYNDTTQHLDAGDIILFENCRFQIKQIETVYYSHSPAYRKGIAIYCGKER